MKKILYLLITLLSTGCARKAEEARDRTATVTLAVMEYEKEVGPIEVRDNRAIFLLLTGQNPKRLKIYNPYSKEEEAGVILDPWEREIRFYRNTEGRLTAWSSGPDGIFSESKESDDIRGDFYPIVRSQP